MKRIVNYSIFEASIPLGLTKAQKDFVDLSVIGDYKYDYETGLINVTGDVNLGGGDMGKKIPKLPGIKFGVVSGEFEASYMGLTSLIGFPTHVGKTLNISNNQLKSLAGSPIYIGQAFFANSNLITDLKGMPKDIFGRINVGNNNLTSLKGSPKKVNSFICHYNGDLISLEGGPSIVEGTFNCSHCPIKTLKGSPNLVKDTFIMNDVDIDDFIGIGQSYIGGISTDWISLNGFQMNKENLIKILIETPVRNINQRHKYLISSFIFNYLMGTEEIENYFKENPTEIYVLDDQPKFKEEILKKTGIKDLSRLGRIIKTRLL